MESILISRAGTGALLLTRARGAHTKPYRCFDIEQKSSQLVFEQAAHSAVQLATGPNARRKPHQALKRRSFRKSGFPVGIQREEKKRKLSRGGERESFATELVSNYITAVSLLLMHCVIDNLR
jgi:hypothetical protein